MFGRRRIKDLDPAEVQAMQAAREIVLIDVREPAEYGAERIHGALNFPLSTFDHQALPLDGCRELVFQCGSGKRSAMAVERCQAGGVTAEAHLAGGIAAWRGAGLPTIAIDPATGAVRDRG